MPLRKGVSSVPTGHRYIERTVRLIAAVVLPAEPHGDLA